MSLFRISFFDVNVFLIRIQTKKSCKKKKIFFLETVDNPFYPGTQLVRIRGYVNLKSMYVEIEAFPLVFFGLLPWSKEQIL